jgi:hypothetical protein
MAGGVAFIRVKGNAFRVLVGKPEENRPLGLRRPRWEDNFKMYRKEIKGVIWIS